MMRVETFRPIQSAGVAAGGRRPEGAPGFSLDAAPGPAAAAGHTAAASLAGLDAMLLLQGEAETPQDRRRRSALRGSDLLDGLDRLKAAILGGRVAAHELRAIAGRLSERSGPSGDPRLDGLVAEIELRAAVELAKIAVARGA